MTTKEVLLYGAPSGSLYYLGYEFVGQQLFYEIPGSATVAGAVSAGVTAAATFSCTVNYQGTAAQAASAAAAFTNVATLQSVLSNAAGASHTFGAGTTLQASIAGAILTSDSVARSDSNNIGSTDGALGGTSGLAWEEVQGDIDVSGEALQAQGLNPGTYGWMAQVNPGGTGDIRLTMSIRIWQDLAFVGPAVRVDSAETAFITAMLVYDDSGNDFFAIRRWSAGAYTSLAIALVTLVEDTTDYEVVIQTRGTRIDAWLDGANQLTVFDSTNQTEPRIAFVADGLAGDKMMYMSVSEVVPNVVWADDAYDAGLRSELSVSAAASAGAAFTVGSTVMAEASQGVSMGATFEGDPTGAVGILAGITAAAVFASGFSPAFASASQAVTASGTFAANMTGLPSISQAVSMSSTFSATMIGGQVFPPGLEFRVPRSRLHYVVTE